MGRETLLAGDEWGVIGFNGPVQMTNRTKASLGLVGAAVVAGLTLGGGRTPSTQPVASTAPVGTAATSAVSDAASGAVSRAVEAQARQGASAAVDQARRTGSDLLAGTQSSGSQSTGSQRSTSQNAGTQKSGSQGSAVTVASTGIPAGASVVLVLDSSRSMGTATTGGATRMDEARTAMTKVIEGLPADARVGLRVYGSTVAVHDPLVPSAAACRDSRAVLPIGPVDKPRLQAVASVFKPFGYTPTSYALERAAADLGTSGPRAIVLVSDGEESCPVDPAGTARRLREQGIDLTISTVGLHAAPAASTQLRDVAAAGGGTYTAANSSSELQSGLESILGRMRAGQTAQGGVGGIGTQTGTGSGWGTGTGAGAGTGSGTATDQRISAAGTQDPGQVRRTTSTTGGGTNPVLPAGFVSALLLLALFFWLGDHK